MTLEDQIVLAIRDNLFISYVEPGEAKGEVVTVRLRTDEVLRLCKQYSEKMFAEKPKLREKYPNGFTNLQLIEDYVVVHWAKIEIEQTKEQTK